MCCMRKQEVMKDGYMLALTSRTTSIHIVNRFSHEFCIIWVYMLALRSKTTCIHIVYRFSKNFALGVVMVILYTYVCVYLVTITCAPPLQVCSWVLLVDPVLKRVMAT